MMRVPVQFSLGITAVETKKWAFNLMCLPYVESCMVWQPFSKVQGYDCFRKSAESKVRVILAFTVSIFQAQH
jgi:hypothetical protein